MQTQELWNCSVEKEFFQQYLQRNNFCSPEKVFYFVDHRYLAYIPKNIEGSGHTLQSRNFLIGQFTEKWSLDLLASIARSLNLYAVSHVVCPEVGLSRQSSGDIAFCTSNEKNQKYQDIKIIFEIKMSILSNYEFNKNKQTIQWIGDYTTHKGTPSLLRSDSMLKAIGKLINIRVYTKNIPLIVLGNSPITRNYIQKVDSLKKLGVVQGFLSINHLLNSREDIIENTPKLGFQTIKNKKELKKYLKNLIDSNAIYFCAMTTKRKLGHIISISNKEKNIEKKAESFLKLIEGDL